MQKLLTTNGGQPFDLDDINYIQNNVKELTSSLAQMVSDSSNPFLLYGGVITINSPGGPSPTMDITNGALWNTDEIYFIEAVTAEALPSGYVLQDIYDNYEWDLNTATSDSRLFDNGTTNDVLEVKTAVLLLTPIIWSGIEADLITYNKILYNKMNRDILNIGDENPATFTEFTSVGSTHYREYTVQSGQHIANWTTPSSANATIFKIIPPLDVFEGYELLIRITPHSTANRGLGFTANLVYTGANIALAKVTIPYNTGVIMDIKTWVDYHVTFNNTSDDIYEIADPIEGYDILGSGAFNLLLKWNNTENKWYEVTRTKLSAV